MPADLVGLVRTLVTTPSVTGEEGAVAALLADRLTAAGWQVTRQPVTPGRDNLYATRARPPVVVLSTHLDTVPGGPAWREADGILQGRGVVDAKGIAAAMIAAAEGLAAQGEDRVGLLFLVGEENGSDGARAAQTLTPKGRFLINGEPTENRLAIAQKGTLRVTLTATGIASHSGYPALGRSAILSLLDAVEACRALELPVDPILGPSTLNVGTIQGGSAPNVIPAAARAELLIRTVAEPEPLRCAIEAIGARHHVAVEFPLEIPPVRSHGLPGWETTTVAYTSDWPILAPWGESYQLGPGTIHQAHTDHEQIAVADLVRGVETYRRLALDLLARPAS